MVTILNKPCHNDGVYLYSYLYFRDYVILKLDMGQTIKQDYNRNPSGKGGFGDNPQNRGSGSWNKEMVFSYQYRRFMNMSLNELNEWRALGDMEKKVVEELAYQAVMRAKSSLPDIKEITDRTEGKAKESLDITTDGESLNKVKQLSDDELEERLKSYLTRSKNDAK